ncbi:MFS transporter [Pseudonocardia ailaonensis]|uniref:MFS transporter n=1 Tax=Pseudonocardia ailaonensis TaxID=367279 RepID=A0ABN2MTJ3_9PSEU
MGRPGTRTRRRPGLVLTVLALCGTVVAMQQTAMVPLLGDLPRLLHTTPDDASWMVTAALLAGAVATPIVSRLADVHGKRLLMTTSLAIMVAGSVIGAFADTLVLGIVARALQGAGLAVIPVGIAAMRDELPPERVPLGVALMSATLAVGAGAGLPLSGFVVSHLDWHAVFWVTGGAGALMLVAVPAVLNPPASVTRSAFDLPGALLLSAGLTALLLALTKGGAWGWTSPATVGCAVGGVLALLAFVPLELRSRSPLVNLRVARRRPVLLVNLASVLLGFAMYANMLVTTQLLQLPPATGFGLGLGTAEAGLWLAPSSLMFGIMAPVAAGLIRRIGAEATLLAGAAVMAGAYVARIAFSHALWQIVGGSVLVAAGTSLTFAAMPTLIIRAVPVTETSSANGLNTLLRSVGTFSSSAATTALTATGLHLVGAAWLPSFSGLSTVFAIAAGSAAVAGAIAVVLRATRQPEPGGTVPDLVLRPVPAGGGASAAARGPRRR